MKDYPTLFSVTAVLMTGHHERHCSSHFHAYPEFFHVQ